MNRREIEAEIRKSLARIAGRDVADVPIDRDLGDALGLDSLDRLELLSDVEERLDVILYDVDTTKASTISGMLEICETAIGERVEAV